MTIVAVAAAICLQAAPPSSRATLGDRVMALTRDSKWTPVATIQVEFPTYHPQGMVKIGEAFFVSSVEVVKPTRRYPAPVDGYDRDTGEGVGHLFRIGADGKKTGEVTLGEGSIYHPGGIDFDGKWIWVPVAEYRPNSRSIVYRVDPGTLKAEEVFRFADHIGGIVHDVDSRSLHGVSWGSRRFYKWAVDAAGRVTDGGGSPDSSRRINPSHYVDYQDCKFAGAHRMLCTGVAEIRERPDATAFRLGGLDLVDLDDGRPLHQLPVLLWTPTGLDMTHNPAWLEAHGADLRAYFMPEDDRSTIYVYDVVG